MGSDSAAANREYHRPESLDLLGSLGRRYGSSMVHEAMREDFARAAAELPDPLNALALDCLTGTGVHIEKMLSAGFGKVIGVDLSESEVARARETYHADPRVDLVVGEISAFLRERPGPYDFIYLGSLHHIDDYVALLEQALACLRPGGAFYLLERPARGWLTRTLVRADDHLFTLLSSPRLWFSRVLSRLGLGGGRAARAWRLAREAEVHATSGLDQDAILRSIRAAGCRLLIHEHMFVPATRLVWWLSRVLGSRNAFRLLAKKEASRVPGPAGGVGK